MIQVQLAAGRRKLEKVCTRVPSRLLVALLCKTLGPRVAEYVCDGNHLRLSGRLSLGLAVGCEDGSKSTRERDLREERQR